MRDDMLNPELFGNEAGEDEDKKRLNDYYLEKAKNKIFYDKDRNLEFVRARKGVGKSALLNYTAIKVEELYKNDIIIKLSTPSEACVIDDDNVGLVILSFCAILRIKKKT